MKYIIKFNTRIAVLRAESFNTLVSRMEGILMEG